ncbi:MAG: putative glycoside hydrolase [Egibacteraceae bacterium]
MIRLTAGLTAVVSLLLGNAVSPVPQAAPPLYRHVVATELQSAAFRASLSKTYSLVTIRGGVGGTPALRKLMGDRGALRVFLYRMGTAVSDETASSFEQQQHPDWLARDKSGQLVRSKPGNSVIDITNPEVRRWLVSSIVSDVEDLGYDGVYLDVLGSFFHPGFYSGRPVIRGTELEDAAWRDASVALIREVKAATGKPVIANGFGLGSGSAYLEHQADTDELIAAADGIQMEQFVRTGSMPPSEFKDVSALRADIDYLRNVSARDKLVLVNTRVKVEKNGSDLEGVRDFALASYLLGREGNALFYFGPPASFRTDKLPNASDVPDYGPQLASILSKLGEPTGPPQESGEALVRKFTGGEVAVNPTQATTSVEIAGEPVSLGPNQARIAVGEESLGPAAAPGQIRPSPAPDVPTKTSPPWLLLGGVALGFGLALVVTLAVPRLRSFSRDPRDPPGPQE